MWNTATMERERDDEDRTFKFVRIKTHVLKIHIHCQGCMRKVKKLLRKVEGVYVVKIEAGEHRVTVSGNVDCARLIDKLAKSGKHAQIWTSKGSNNRTKNEVYLNKKPHSLDEDRDFSNHHPREKNIPSWEFNSDVGSGITGMGSVEYNTSDIGYYAPEQYDGFKNTYAATPVYEYQYPLPAAVDNMQSSWHNNYYPYSMEYANVQNMHPVSNNMMHVFY